MKRSTAIIIFARAPQPGLVKTRLIPALGEQGALNLYRAMLIHALQIAHDSDPDELVLACTPDADDVELKAMGQAVGAYNSFSVVVCLTSGQLISELIYIDPQVGVGADPDGFPADV